MAPSDHEAANRKWADIASAFLKLGTTAYGGPAIMGIMQVELQQKRRWLSKERFVEGLSLVNMLPGAGATQLGIFLGYARGGWWGGLLAGLCFVLPAFFIMLALTIGYAAYGATPVLKGALYGLGPVVMGIFLVALYRLGRSAAATIPQFGIAAAAAAAAATAPFGIVTILALAAAVGLLLFHSRKHGFIALAVMATLIAIGQLARSFVSVVAPAPAPVGVPPYAASLIDLAGFFFMVGALSFGGGLTMIAFIQEQVVNHYRWLSPREFIDGLALGQFTPGPILMVSAYVGYKAAGVSGAVVSAAAIFSPSFVLMLSVLPVFERVRRLAWTRAAMKGIGPAVIGVLGVSLMQMAPHAVPDWVAAVVLIGTVIALLAWQIGAIKLIGAGALVGVLRSRVQSLAAVRTAIGPA
jgi:chromate transporter